MAHTLNSSVVSMPHDNEICIKAISKSVDSNLRADSADCLKTSEVPPPVESAHKRHWRRNLSRRSLSEKKPVKSAHRLVDSGYILLDESSLQSRGLSFKTACLD